MKSSGVYTTRLMFVPTSFSNGILPNMLKACWAPGKPGHPDSRSSHHLFLATQPGINPSSVTIVLASETNFKHSTGGGPVKLYMNLLAPGIIQHYCQVFDLLDLLHQNHLQGKVDSEIPACSEKLWRLLAQDGAKRNKSYQRPEGPFDAHYWSYRHWPQSTNLAAHCLHVVTHKTA